MAAVVLLAAAGCATFEQPQPDLASIEKPDRCVVVFLLDGLNPSQFKAEIEGGRLPHIEHHLVRRGMMVEPAVSSLPTITYPNCTSLITGRFPGHHGILGNSWFDRQTLQMVEYINYSSYRSVNAHIGASTLFDWLDDEFTVNVQGHTRRGVSATIDNDPKFAFRWLIGQYTEADRAVGRSFTKVTRLAAETGRWPAVINAYFPGLDQIGHRFGPQSPQYGYALIGIDAAIGQAVSQLKQAGLYDRSFLILTSDHSMVSISADQRMDLVEWLKANREGRFRTRRVNRKSYKDRLAALRHDDAVIIMDSGRAAMIHLRGDDGWVSRPTYQQTLSWIKQQPSLCDLPAVGLAACRMGRDRVACVSRDGLVEVERRYEDEHALFRICRYEGDPLGYLRSSAVAEYVSSQAWLTGDRWLELTATLDSPDFVPQIVALFDSRRTGDIVLFAADGHSFHPDWHGAHGSCLASDMQIPLLVAGPGIRQHGVDQPMRLVDLAPTILGLIRQEDVAVRFDRIDGRNMADHLLDGRGQARSLELQK